MALQKSTVPKLSGVAYSTFREYKKKYSAFSALIKSCKRNVVQDVRAALVKKAKGFEYTETKKTYMKVDLPVKTLLALRKLGYTEEGIDAVMTIKEEVSNKVALPDTNAANLVLKNYDKHQWSNDPQMLEIKKKELKLKEKVVEANNW